MKKKLLLAIIILFSTQGFSQQDCFFVGENTIDKSITEQLDCNDYLNYTPDTNTSVLVVKINFHFFRNDDGTGIYQPKDSNKIDTIMDWLNLIYRNLQPPTIATPQLSDTIQDSKIAFKLMDVYYHDNSLFYNNDTSACTSSIYDNFGINKGSEINVFFYLNPRFPVGGGCAGSAYVNMHNTSMLSIALWSHAQLLAHELGHSLGLPHTWQDSFDDTFFPDNNTSGLPCNTTSISNNIMGYNTCRSYLSPKQLGFVHWNILSHPYKMKYIACCQDTLNFEMHITNDTDINHCMYFDKNVIIDSGVTVSSFCTLYFTNNARLIVRPGGKLVVDGGTLTSACAGEMWQGTVELRDSAVVENAFCAIRTGLREDTVNFATTGGIILADSAYFTNNLRAVEINSYAYTTPSGGIANYVSSFKNCTFTVDDNNLLAANDTVFSEHVKLWEVKGVSFEGCTFLNQTSGLSGKGRGIYAHDAGIVLDVKCNGDGAMAVGLCGCQPEWSDSCLFNGFTTAVEVNTSGTPYAVTVNRVKFENNTTGVRINGNNFATVTRCDFDLTTNAQGLRYLYGLYLNGCLGFKVEANQYSGTVQYFNGITTGIHVNESGSSSNSLYKNLFNSLTYGVRTYGNNSGLKIQCNEFDSGGADIFVSPGSSISSSQGSLQTSAGNKFQQTYGMNISNGGIQSIKYYYKNSVTNSYAEPTLYSGSVYVTLSNDTNTCASTLCNNGGWIVNGTGPSLAQFQSSIAGTDDDSAPQGGANSDTAAWQTLSDTYHAAVRSIMSDTVLNLSTLEQWHTAAQPIADPYSLAETRFMEGYAEPFIADADDAEMANYAEFHALKLALASDNDNQDNLDNLDNLNSQNSSNSPTTNWYSLTPAQIAQLQTIAERNTGRASVMAKGVLCFFFGICYEDESPLPELRSDKGNTKSGQPQWTYWIIDPMAPVYVPVTYSLLGDTVVDGFSYRISNFHVPSSDRAERPLLVQEDSSGMYYYDHVFHERKLLYPYLAEPGFQYTIYPIFGDTNHLMIVHVDSVAYEDIDNQNVKVLYVSTHDTNYQEPYLHWSFDMSGGMNHAKIIEHIGSTGYFLPVETAYNGFFLVKSLCSYESEDLNYQLVDSVNCNEPYHYSVPQHSASEIRVYPNPAGDLLHIELSCGGGIASVALYDLQGRVVETRHGTSLQGGTATVNLRSVPAGVYLLRVRDAEGKEYMRKIVKK